MNLFFEQYRYKFFKKKKNEIFTILEIGIGNDSPYKFRKLFRNSIYHGIDKNLDYNISENSIRVIDKFFPKDLETDLLEDVPNEYYDYIIIAHVIEHLANGEEVLGHLIKKMKKDALMYIEYPSERSKYFPSMKGTLNFFDDPTHKRFYSFSELTNLFLNKNLEILRSGVKRDFWRIFALPLTILISFFRFGYIRGSVFWDLLGFSEYFLVRK